MNVLFDAHQIGRAQTGNETYVRELLRSLSSIRDIDLTAAVASAGASEFVTALGAAAYCVSTNGAVRLLELEFAARRRRSDLLHSIYYALPATRRPSVVTIHDISFEMYPEFFSRAAVLKNRILVPLAARSATVVVTVSEASRTEIVERYRIDPAKVVAIHNGVSPVFSLNPSAAQPAGGAFRILAVGTLQPRKNLTRLLEAIRMVAKTRDVSLKIIGPDGYQAEVIRATLKNAPWVEITGYLPIEALAIAYRHADLFVYPSVYEGFGLPVLEAMASGTPVITTQGGSLPEIAGDAAILVDALNTEDMANAIGALADDEGLRQRLRTKGLERATQFTWARSAEEHVHAYELALRGA